MAQGSIKEPVSNNVTIKHVSIPNIAIGANTSVDIDLSPYIPTGKVAITVSQVKHGDYMFPYFSSALDKGTWIERLLYPATLRIKNTASAWSAADLNFILYLTSY